MSPAQATAAPFWPGDSMHACVGLDELTATQLRQAISYWDQLRAGRRFPARAELNPRQMTKLLPYMSLVKVIDGGADFEHRIVGDIMVQAYRVNIQNRRFSDIANDAPQFVAGCLPFFRRVAEHGEPVAWRTHTGHHTTDIVFTHSEVVLLPLGAEAVDHIVGFGRQWSGAAY
jgi:hypothetical protein